MLNNLEIIQQKLLVTLVNAGVVARSMQDGIVNIGKDVEKMADESEAHYQMRQAKSEVDVIVQDMILASLYTEMHDVVSLDVEEDSKWVAYYPISDYEYTLVIDPIDGSLPYINKQEHYSICVGLMHQNDFLFAYVYFPALDLLYGYYHHSFMIQQLSKKGFHQDEEITYKLTNQPKIYCNARLNQAMKNQLSEHFELVDDQKHPWGVPGALLSLCKGESIAYICKNRNIRDVLLALIISKLDGAYLYDFNGNKILWAKKGRQQELIVSFYPSQKILKKFAQSA